MNIVAVTD